MTIRIMRRGKGRFSPTFLLVLLLAGCLGTQKPAPVVNYGLQGGADSAGLHTLAAGETLWTVSQRYRVSMQDLVYVNGLSPPYTLKPGQRLKLPPPATYRTKEGDTLYGVSRLFGVNQNRLAQMNDLRPPYAVSPGSVLKLPSARPSAAVSSRPVAIAARMEARPAERVDRQPLAQMEVAAMPLPSAGKKPAPVAVRTAVPSRTGSKFIWPVNGPVLSSYGPKKGGLHNDGMNIGAARGAPVRAAENGVVVYAGNELKGFGNLVLLKHADRWVTAYGHLDRLDIKRGDVVRQGQTVGVVGSTGTVSSPQLHFEVRRGAEALNPELHLAKKGV